MKFYSWKVKAERNLRQLTKLPSHCKSKKRCNVVKRGLRPDFLGHPKNPRILHGIPEAGRRSENSEVWAATSYCGTGKGCPQRAGNPCIPKIPAFTDLVKGPRFPSASFRVIPCLPRTIQRRIHDYESPDYFPTQKSLSAVRMNKFPPLTAILLRTPSGPPLPIGITASCAPSAAFWMTTVPRSPIL